MNKTFEVEDFPKLCRSVYLVHNCLGNGYAGGPYSDHLQAVDDKLVEWFPSDLDPDLKLRVRIGGLFHDYFEDIALTQELLPQTIQTWVDEWQVPLISLEMALLCTDPEGVDRDERKAKAYPRIARCYGALLIKLADRICNLRASRTNNPRLLERYLREHRGFELNLCFVRKARLPALAPIYCSAVEEYQRLVLAIQSGGTP